MADVAAKKAVRKSDFVELVEATSDGRKVRVCDRRHRKNSAARILVCKLAVGCLNAFEAGEENVDVAVGLVGRQLDGVAERQL